jgi:hypothetical protein
VPAVTDLLAPLVTGVPAMLADVAAAMREVAPEYAEALAEHEDEVHDAARLAMRRVVAEAEQGMGPAPQTPDAEAFLVRDLFDALGRGQWRAGNPLPTLLSAFQTGARVAWWHVAHTAVAAAVEPETMAALGAAVFRLVDQLSSAATAGYLAEQDEDEAARQRLRYELVELLLSDRSHTDAVRLAARRADWPLPDLATVVLALPDDKPAEAAMSRLGPGALHFRSGQLAGAVVAAPGAERGRERLSQFLAGSAVAVGPFVDVARLPVAARLTRLAADLLRSGVVRERPLFVDEHVGELIVYRDRQLLAGLRRKRLAPLDGAGPARPALEATLRAWLVHLGDTRRMAEELQVHPQTVRYRLGRLRELFGAELDDPRTRMELLLVLGWE